MALKGEAKADWQREYMRDYMRRRREAAGPQRRTPDAPTESEARGQDRPGHTRTRKNRAALVGDRVRVLFAHAANPDGLTDFELASLVNSQQNSAGKRRHELRNDGYIEQSQFHRAAPSGATAIVWRITETGLELARVMIEQQERDDEQRERDEARRAYEARSRRGKQAAATRKAKAAAAAAAQ